uniref:DFDF domain-containing protein n=1 Tax=Mesocestoides corti TaxID=53468 RepID=A0A5K3F460_MESCO
MIEHFTGFILVLLHAISVGLFKVNRSFLVMSDFSGYKVEIASNQLGTIVGTVTSYNENKIDLVNALVNGKTVREPQYSVDKQFISQLRIISTLNAPSGDSQAAVGVHQSPSSRDLRRDKLRNIPGACTAYVCDRSPPRVIKTPKSQLRVHHKNPDNSLEKGSAAPKSGNVGAAVRRRNRSKSTGEGVAQGYCSGCESDPVASHTSKSANPDRRRRKPKRNASGSSTNGLAAGWESLRIEDFIDKEFDFEANLALFDKKAFYEKADAAEACDGSANGNKGRLRQLFPDVEQVLVEGPNGIGFVPASDANSAETPTPIKAQRQHEQNTVASPLCTPTPAAWSTPTGHKVPFLSSAVHDRILHYLATGKDVDGVVPALPQGLTWDRIIETAGLAVVNAAVNFLKQSPAKMSNRTGQQQQPPSSRPPLRVLVLPGTANLAGALAINAARHLACRGGACVLLYCPPTASAGLQPSVNAACGDVTASYRVEMTLAQTLAPKAALFVTDDDDVEAEEDEASIVDSGDGEFTSQAGRMWISRIPGLKVVSTVSGVTCRPRNALIDLLILGQPLDQYDKAIRDWLTNHTAICLTVQVAKPQSSLTSATIFPPRSLKSWLIQLGLPTVSPSQCPLTVDVHLVDVGMSRSLVSRVTGDLRALPPMGLFDTTFTVHLTSKGSM